uniref:Uncharacterized protein n=1 Tax=Rhizophora mucronata TaxID=61149 RepID=A0A2P2QAU5_RHIMU
MFIFSRKWQIYSKSSIHPLDLIVPLSLLNFYFVKLYVFVSTFKSIQKV